jgi:hypothetical protein
LYLEVPSGRAFGLSASALLLALRNATAARPDVFAVRAGAPPPGAITAIADDRRIAIDLAKVTMPEIQLGTYFVGETGDEFGIDATVIAALAFDRVGRTDIATRLTTGFVHDSSLVVVPEVAWGLAATLRRSRRVTEASVWLTSP